MNKLLPDSSNIQKIYIYILYINASCTFHTRGSNPIYIYIFRKKIHLLHIIVVVIPPNLWDHPMQQIRTLHSPGRTNDRLGREEECIYIYIRVSWACTAWTKNLFKFKHDGQASLCFTCAKSKYAYVCKLVSSKSSKWTLSSSVFYSKKHSWKFTFKRPTDNLMKNIQFEHSLVKAFFKKFHSSLFYIYIMKFHFTHSSVQNSPFEDLFGTKR